MYALNSYIKYVQEQKNPYVTSSVRKFALEKLYINQTAFSTIDLSTVDSDYIEYRLLASAYISKRFEPREEETLVISLRKIRPFDEIYKFMQKRDITFSDSFYRYDISNFEDIIFSYKEQVPTEEEFYKILETRAEEIAKTYKEYLKKLKIMEIESI